MALQWITETDSDMFGTLAGSRTGSLMREETAEGSHDRVSEILVSAYGLVGLLATPWFTSSIEMSTHGKPRI